MEVNVNIKKVLYSEVIKLREQFLTERPFQVRYDACH